MKIKEFSFRNYKNNTINEKKEGVTKDKSRNWGIRKHTWGTSKSNNFWVVYFLKMLIKILGKPVEAIMNKGESTNTTYVYEYMEYESESLI